MGRALRFPVCARYCLSAAKSKADLHDVRLFLGHANVTTTSRYVRSTPVRLAEALERMEASVEPTDDVAESPHATELQ